MPARLPGQRQPGLPPRIYDFTGFPRFVLGFYKVLQGFTRILGNWRPRRSAEVLGGPRRLLGPRGKLEVLKPNEIVVESYENLLQILVYK